MYNLKPVPFSIGWEKANELYKENFATMEKYDKEAKAKGELVNRYINHPCADGYAYYLITKENKTTVRIKCLKNLGDDWVLQAWGEETTIPKTTALNFIKSREALNELFKKPKGFIK